MNGVLRTCQAPVQQHCVWVAGLLGLSRLRWHADEELSTGCVGG